MAGEKYIVAAVENPLQIAVRNILNPNGYIFLGNCYDSISLLRMIRSYHPDFVVVDSALQIRELKITIEAIDDDMLCACIIVGTESNNDINDLMMIVKTYLSVRSRLTRKCLSTLSGWLI